MDHFNTTKGLRKGILVYTRYLKRVRLLIDKKMSYKKLLPVYLVYKK
jgi:hypothetical protein